MSVEYVTIDSAEFSDGRLNRPFDAYVYWGLRVIAKKLLPDFTFCKMVLIS
jgi:hypothetical protein